MNTKLKERKEKRERVGENFERMGADMNARKHYEVVENID